MIEPLLYGRDLTAEQAHELMVYLTGGEATDAQIGAVCAAMRIKTCTATELAGFASVLREQSLGPKHGFHDLVDTCGTGGGVPSFNISTAAAFVSAACGVRIAKHGNRGVTSAYGSADVLETLGAKIQTEESVLLRMLQHVGIGFLYAPAHHPGMRHVGKARKDLGFRTLFNQLGPLANPIDAKRQLVGVYDPKIAFAMAEALMKMGSERALVAHGEDGLDEISPVTATRFALLWDGELSEGILTPRGFGIEPVSVESIQPGKSAEENADRLRQAVTHVDLEISRAVLPSAACAIWIADLAPDRRTATEMARESIRSGAAREKLESFISESQRA